MSLPDARDLNTASVKFVVRSKETGQLLGSALLLPEVTVKDGDVQFVPWSENEDNVLPPDLILGNRNQESPGDGDNEEVESELNISSSRSVSSEGGSSVSSHNYAVVSHDCSQLKETRSPGPISASAQDSKPQPDLAIRDEFKDGIEIPNMSLVSMKVEENDCGTHNNNERNAIKRKDERIDREEIVDDSDERLSKVQKIEESKDRLEVNTQSSGVVGKYDMFVEFVKDKNNFNGESVIPKHRQKVSCLLCGDIISHGNIGRHIENFHESSSVNCKICNAKFAKKRYLRSHMKSAHCSPVDDGIKSSNDVKIKTVSTSKVHHKPLKKTSPVSIKKPIKRIDVSDIKSDSSLPCEFKSSSKPIIHAPIMKSGNSVTNKSEKTDHDPSPVPDKTLMPPPSNVEVHSEIDGLITLTMKSNSLKGFSMKMGLEKHVRVKKAMRKFAKRFNVNYKELKFMFDNEETNVTSEILGDEIVGDMKNRNFTVYGDLSL